MLLRRGDRGPAVADLREALASLQLLPSLNGSDRSMAEFDAATDGAIRDFQQRRGLIVDGIVGPVTVRSLTDARWTLGDRALTHTLSAPMTGDDVMALQTRLAEMGYNTGRPDGIFGPLTDACVRDFQRHRGLSEDGVFGPETYRELNRIGRMVTGGRPQYLREYQLVRQAGTTVARQADRHRSGPWRRGRRLDGRRCPRRRPHLRHRQAAAVADGDHRDERHADPRRAPEPQPGGAGRVRQRRRTPTCC